MYRYLYCITRKVHKPFINVVGIGNANVHALQYEDIAAILSEVVMTKIPVSNGNVLRHAAVIETVRKEQTVLPMRYLSVFKDDAGVIEFLKNRYAVFVSDLERLHDKMEMGLRIIMKNTVQNKDDEELSDEKCSSNPGIDYLHQRRIYYASLDENDADRKSVVKTCH